MHDHFAKVGLPVIPPAARYDVGKLVALMAQDKKAEEGRMTLILARGIGKSFISRDVDAAQVRAVWDEFLPA